MADTVTYDEQRDRYYVDISLDNPDSVPDAVVYSVADILDEEPLSLSPLGETLDTDALTKLFNSSSESTGDVAVSFKYSGYDIKATQSGRITFEPVE